MLLLFLGALSVLVLAVLVLISWRLNQVGRRVDALRAGVDRVRVDVAQLQRETGLEPDGGTGDGPRIVRRKRHLGLVGQIAAGLGIAAAWIREHRAASIATAAAVTATVALVIVSPWDTDGSHDPPSSSAPSLTHTATGSEPPTGPAPSHSSGPPTEPGETVLPTSGSPRPSSTADVTEAGPEPTAAATAAESSDSEPGPGPSGTATPSPQPGSTPPATPPGQEDSTPTVALPAGAVQPYTICVDVSARPLLDAGVCLLGAR